MELIQIGKVLKTHGIKGQLKVFINAFYMDDFEGMKAIFINGLPYFISYTDINSDEYAIINLEEIDTKEKAQKLAGKDIFAKEDDLSEIMDEDPFSDLTGYTIHDVQLGIIGTIEEIIEMPQQYLAKVIREASREVLIPMNNVFIQSIDDDQQIVIMDLPEGLLDIS